MRGAATRDVNISVAFADDAGGAGFEGPIGIGAVVDGGSRACGAWDRASARGGDHRGVFADDELNGVPFCLSRANSRALPVFSDRCGRVLADRGLVHRLVQD
jgi:hypothetical protein